jgi:rubrerythrin
MPIRRELQPRSIDAAAINEGRVDSHYVKVLIRLLAAHAMAEKLTAIGYQRALSTVDNPELKPILEKNFAEEKTHARRVYDAALAMTEHTRRLHAYPSVHMRGWSTTRSKRSG